MINLLIERHFSVKIFYYGILENEKKLIQLTANCLIMDKEEQISDISKQCFSELKKYLLEDPTFDDTRDSKFLKNVIKFISDPPNPEGFRKEIQSYKTLRELDKWKLTMFAMAIKNIEKQEDDEDLK